MARSRSSRSVGEHASPSAAPASDRSRDRKVVIVSAILLLTDLTFTAFIIFRVPYTKIDWDAYMSQVDGFLEGERDYTKLSGETGPLVYPAGFLYVYSAIQYVTNGAIFPAQIGFGLLYIVNLGIVLSIYNQAKVLPWWAICLLCLSKRVHSIFVLRLFNDCIATTLAHVAILLFQSNKWKSGMVVFSVAVSVKMNVLLYAPPLLLLILKAVGIMDAARAILLATLVQLILGKPFLLSYPVEYLSSAFDLGRVFIHFWSVNFKFVPEGIFLSKKFAAILLAVHLGLLLMFAHCKWCKHEGGLVRVTDLKHKLHQPRSLLSLLLQKFCSRKKGMHNVLTPEHVTTVLFTGNFIGILCARSLHYQFYSWYFYTLPYLLWKAPLPTFSRLILFGLIEACWNVYPSNSSSSFVLLLCHVILAWGLWQTKTEYPYISESQQATKLE